MPLRDAVAAAHHGDIRAEEIERARVLARAVENPRAALALIARDMRRGLDDATGESAAALLRIARALPKK